MHGGIGCTSEANCHFYYRRERMLAVHLGNRVSLGRPVAECAAGQPGEGGVRWISTTAPEEAAFRSQARDWLAAHASAHELTPGRKNIRHRRGRPRPGVDARALRGRLVGPDLSQGARWARAVGRGGGDSAEEEGKYHLPKGPFTSIGTGMALLVIAKHGTDAQRARFIEATLKGDLTWCQLFSEPAAGSDLAALRTSRRARR